jgi:ligand-binding sensor domain-containing protein
VSICALQPDGTKSVKNISLAEGLPDVVVTALAKDPQGRIWMGSNNGGIWWVDPLTLAVHRPCPEWPYGEVHTIAAFSPYEIWCAGSEGGLLQINPATGAVQVVAPDWRIRQLLRDREGQLWLLLENGTVWSANLQVLRMHTPSQPVQAVCKDREGRLWVGAQNGLWRYAEGRWIPAGRPGLNVISLMVSPQGEVWAGTFGQGICVFSPEGRLLRCITTRNGLPNGSILSMAAGDFAWAGTLDGLVGIDWVSYQVRRFSALSGQAAAERFYIYKLLTDRTGALWMCTDGHGICRWSPGKWECFEEGAGVSLKTVYTAAEDRTGAIWLAGAFTGLLRFDGARFTRYGSEQHLHSTHIQSIVPTPDGKIVIAYSDGIDILTPETGHVTFLGENAGVATAEHHLNAAWCDGEGQVWLGATEGLSRVAGFAQDFAIDPFTIISSVTVSSQIIDFQKEKVFAYDQNHLLIEYNGIWHTHPGAVFFRYRLEGFDPDWILSKDRLVSYPNLPPGKYVFRVQSSEHGRFEHTGEAVFVFEIKKPFWTEWWFVLLGILGALLALRAYVQAREKRMLREKELQNEKIAAQLSAIKTQINPHFLFNSFNTLVTLIEENPGLAVDYVQHLSDFYRSIMIYREKDLIPLSEELKIAENFGFLLKKRYEDALLITLPENRAEKSGYVFPLTLQMLMENAVKHNVISKKQPLQLVISFEKGGYIVVSNNLHLKIKPEPGAGFGLQSLIHRYALMTGQKVIVTDANGWFSVKIPLVQYEHTIS